jgi:hypothetical protein
MVRCDAVAATDDGGVLKMPPFGSADRDMHVPNGLEVGLVVLFGWSCGRVERFIRHAFFSPAGQPGAWRGVRNTGWAKSPGGIKASGSLKPNQPFTAFSQ